MPRERRRAEWLTEGSASRRLHHHRPQLIQDDRIELRIVEVALRLKAADFLLPFPSGSGGFLGSRTGRPAAAKRRLHLAMVNVPKWNTLAASSPSPRPRAPSTKCSSVPTPPEAITGTLHRLADRARQIQVEAAASAVAVHAGQQDLARAQRRPLRAHSTASIPVAVRPPWV